MNQILQSALDNLRESKAGRVSGLPNYKSKQSVFDDIIREDEKIRDKKIEIENQKAAYRTNEAVLASKNYELRMLELERDKLDNSIKSLIDRQKQSENTLKDVQQQ